ncbi:TetR/AcrR family transcriptional regulator [Devriesea agamarum]|uniref:TetR/AcrR family transcriptional regulator n=1 Tax=Devriesea agamarum TaxID=472569 RepID=UPI001E4CF281|nr:TetR/AcrR family transcriptional regulator [Devriesea agamarum]
MNDTPSADQVTTKTRAPRMTGRQRREQLLTVGGSLFAAKGFDGTSVEEIAATAGVSKPVVYEHFGGKEGLYAVVVDRETRILIDALDTALRIPSRHPKVLMESAALALLTYIETHEDGFRILVRDSPVAQATGTFSSLLGDVANTVESLLIDQFSRRDHAVEDAAMYAQMLVGMVAYTGQWWLETRSPSKEQVAAHMVNLSWFGLKNLKPEPRLRGM